MLAIKPIGHKARESTDTVYLTDENNFPAERFWSSPFPQIEYEARRQNGSKKFDLSMKKSLVNCENN